MNAIRPIVGQWYRGGTNELFEVVAIDDQDQTIEIQYFDGTVAEFELEDWEAQRTNGEIEDAEAPEDWTGSVDVDVEDEDDGSGHESQRDEGPRSADGLEGLDLFDAADSS